MDTVVTKTKKKFVLFYYKTGESGSDNYMAKIEGQKY